MNKPKILIVDDHEGFLESLVESPILLSKYCVFGANEGKTAMRILYENPDIACVLLDYDLKGKSQENIPNGLEIMKEISQISPQIPIFMMSGITEQRGAVAIESIEKHAVCFLDKPFPLKMLMEELKKVISKPNGFEEELDSACEVLSKAGFFSKSKIMKDVCLRALKASKNNFPLMITGETGTGKTALARAVHKLSGRADKPFVEINCGNFSSDTNTFHSQLFGHTKGAFTGAMKSNKGFLEAAYNGTILFDDITAMPVDIQKGMLQVIESKKYRRFGNNTDLNDFDSRIISTSNIPLSEAISSNLLREDLKYRLTREIIYIPPLRSRPEDIEIIVLHFLENSDEMGMNIREVSKEALTLLKKQPWLGNVRQLLNVAARASAHERDSVISFNTVQSELFLEYGFDVKRQFCYETDDIEIDGDLETTINNIRERIIIKYLKKHNGALSVASRDLGFKNHNSLKYWIDKLKISCDNGFDLKTGD